MSSNCVTFVTPRHLRHYPPASDPSPFSLQAAPLPVTPRQTSARWTRARCRPRNALKPRHWSPSRRRVPVLVLDTPAEARRPGKDFERKPRVHAPPRGDTRYGEIPAETARDNWSAPFPFHPFLGASHLSSNGSTNGCERTRSSSRKRSSENWQWNGPPCELKISAPLVQI